MPDDTPTREELRRSVRRLGLTQQSLADQFGVSQTAIALWFKGEVTSARLDAAIPAFLSGVELGMKRAA